MSTLTDVAQRTSVPIVYERSIDDIFTQKTYVPEISEEKASQERLTYHYPLETEVENDTIQYTNSSSLSDQYVSHNISVLIAQIKKELDIWATDGTTDSLPQISNIKELLDQYSSYMSEDPQHDMLLGYLELIFANNNWTNMQESQIRQLSRELDRFQDGDVSWKQLQSFSKQLFRSGYSTLKYDEEGKQTEEKN